MDYKLGRSAITNNICALILLFPVFFSFLFAMIGIPIPSYLIIIIISALILLFIANSALSFKIYPIKIMLLLLFAWILSSIVYTNSVIASKEKFINIIYNTIIPITLIELFFLFSKEKVLNLQHLEKKLLRYAYFLIWFSLIAFMLFREQHESGRYSLPGLDNPIWFSRFIGMLIIIIVYCEKITTNNIHIYASSLLAAILLMFSSGSRGPLLAVLLTYLFIKSFSTSKKKIALLLIAFVMTILIGFKFVGGYMFETNFYSLTDRLNLISLFSDFEFDYFKGNGIGSYSLSFFGEDVIMYPHNVFFELFFENGLVGVVLFSITMWLFFRKFKPNVINFLCFFYFLTSLPSGDIPGNNNLFILLFISSYANESTLKYHLRKRQIKPLPTA